MSEYKKQHPKKYKVVYANLPWSYNDKSASGKRGACFKREDIANITLESFDINAITDNNSLLFLWSPLPLLPEALSLMSKWGFTHKTVGFTWVKKNKYADSLFWGMGNWTRSNSEVCLLAVKGKPKRESAAVHSVVVAPVEKNQEKPAEIKDRIVKLCGDVHRLELFGKQPTPGWDIFDYSVDSSINIPLKNRDAYSELLNLISQCGNIKEAIKNQLKNKVGYAELRKIAESCTCEQHHASKMIGVKQNTCHNANTIAKLIRHLI